MLNLHLKIRAIRELRGYTQEYLAEQTGVSLKTYNRIEAGRAPLTVKRFAKIAGVLQVTEQEIHLFDLDQHRYSGKEVLDWLSSLELLVKSLKEKLLEKTEEQNEMSKGPPR